MRPPPPMRGRKAGSNSANGASPAHLSRLAGTSALPVKLDSCLLRRARAARVFTKKLHKFNNKSARFLVYWPDGLEWR